jgi:hypothetical protein
MSAVTWEDAEPRDAIELSRTLRAADYSEIMKVTCRHPIFTLEEVVRVSRQADFPCKVGVWKHEVVSRDARTGWTFGHGVSETLFLIGCIPMHKPNGLGFGCIWGVGSNKMYDHLVGLHRGASAEIDKMQEQYGQLECWADPANTVHHAWLERFLGFEYRNDEPYGVMNIPFRHYVRERIA